MTQKHLEKSLQKIFPSYRIFNQNYWNKIARNLKLKDILTNARKASQTLNPASNHWLELDCQIPDLKLAFEYQVLQL